MARVTRYGRTAALAGTLLLALGPALQAAPYPWQEPQARVLPTGDLEWAPRPFAFAAGGSTRFIDFATGDDANPGDRREAPWKHHPWDPEARANAKACRGVITYVFKGGTVYRGRLAVTESGAPGDPIRLTRDPSWGEGDAVLAGSMQVTGWTKGAAHPDIPAAAAVWWADLDFAPRCVWTVGPRGEVHRIPLARTPNWTVSDPDDVKSEWWYWDYQGTKPFDVFTEVRGRRLHLGVDTIHLTQPADDYQDAILWTEHGWVMGAPYPVRVETVDTQAHGLGFGGRWGAAGDYKIVRFCRYFLEDKPHYLDDPKGEFWFERKGDGGRLYLRLPGDADPNGSHIEAARYTHLIDAKSLNHVHITGLTFRFTNPHWQLDGVPYAQGEDLDPACVRLLGPGTDLRVANCRFEHVQSAVRLKALGPEDVIDGVVLSDNDLRDMDRGGFNLAEGSAWGEVLPRSGLLNDVQILRNRLRNLGLRPTRFDLGFAINVLNARTAQVAGNVIERCYSGGINVAGAKRSGSARDCPLTRLLIYHNKVTDPLLSNDDFGGIETWQGGPAYVFNNISGNPGGYRNFWLLDPKRPGSARFGHAYYLDGAFKNYHFNNIAWGKSSDPFSRLGNAAAFQEIHSYQNTFFNNTVYNFVKGTRRQAPQAGRDKYLGNVWQDIGEWVFWHAPPAKAAAEGNAADAGSPTERFALETNAYSRNVFHAVPKQFAVIAPDGRWHESVEAFRQALAAGHALAADVGEIAAVPPLRDPAAGDFRLTADSAALDRGVRVFVPWALYAEVAEWGFARPGGDPSQVLDEHWYLTPYHLKRDDYYRRPMYPLRAVKVTADSYVAGALEDWTAGALQLNGRDQYAALTNAELAEPFRYELTYSAGGKPTTEQRLASGPDLKNVQVHASSFLIEVCFRTEAGHTGGVLAEKMAGAGYSLSVGSDGGLTFVVKADKGSGTVAGKARVNDGGWHHAIAECDRQAKALTLYVDGRRDATGTGVDADTSLANDGDFYAGGTPTGRCLAGALDFMRLALGTLAEAQTTIDELYAWEFDGPARRDFTGHPPAGARRDAGAMEAVD